MIRALAASACFIVAIREFSDVAKVPLQPWFSLAPAWQWATVGAFWLLGVAVLARGAR